MRLRLVSACLFACFAGVVSAQWSVTILHPEGAKWSEAYAVGPGGVVGGIVQYEDTEEHAAVWHGTAESFKDMGEGNINSTDGTHFGGTSPRPDFDARALYWQNDSSPAEDRTPASWEGRFVYGASISGVWGNQAVGTVVISPFEGSSSDYRGKAAMWVDGVLTYLDPFPFDPYFGPSSLAYATDGAQQVGEHGRKAALWSGTAASYVNLHPAGATWSWAVAVSNGRQGGVAMIGGNPRPALWSGTASSFIDLTPQGATSGRVVGISKDYQVGWASYKVGAKSMSKRGIWKGTADSFVDLGQFMPEGYSLVRVNGIYQSDSMVYVVGSGYDGIGRTAILMTMPVPEPNSMIGLTMLLGTLACLRLNRRIRCTADHCNRNRG